MNRKQSASKAERKLNRIREAEKAVIEAAFEYRTCYGCDSDEITAWEKLNEALNHLVEVMA